MAIIYKWTQQLLSKTFVGFDILHFLLKAQYWWVGQTTHLNLCENSKTVICNLSRNSPSPWPILRILFRSYNYCIHSRHFSTVRLLVAMHFHKQKNYPRHFLHKYYTAVSCVCFAVYQCNLHICCALRLAHIYSIKWPLMAFSRCEAQNGSKYSITSETAYFLLIYWVHDRIIEICDDDDDCIVGLNIPLVWLILHWFIVAHHLIKLSHFLALLFCLISLFKFRICRFRFKFQGFKKKTYKTN